MSDSIVQLQGLVNEKFGLAFVEFETRQPGSWGGVDFSIRATSVLGQFACEVVVWIEREAWRRFLVEVAALERDRVGRASLQSVSPDDSHSSCTELNHPPPIAASNLMVPEANAG